jgi:hypothetical protein
MLTVATTLASLTAEQDAARDRALNRRLKAITFAALWALALLATTLNAAFLWTMWTALDRNITFFSVALVLALVAWAWEVAAIAVLTIRARPKHENARAAQVLRELIARNDDALTPLAALQPRSASPEDMAREPIIVQPLRFTGSLVATVWKSVIVGLVVLILAGTSVSLYIWSEDGAIGNQWFLSSSPLIGFVLTMLSLLLNGSRLITSFRRKGTKVVFDHLGITFGRGQNARHIRWPEIRCLFQIDGSSAASASSEGEFAASQSGVTYIVSDGNTLLRWTVATNAKPVETQATELFLRYIAAHTELPLRDATMLAREVASHGTVQAQVMLAHRMNQSNEPSLPATIAVAFNQLVPMPAPRLSRLKMAMIAAIVLLLGMTNAPMPIAGLRLDRANSRYRASALGIMRAQGTLYATDFSYNTGVWEESSSADADPHKHVFADGAYHLRGPIAGQLVNAVYPLRVGNGAVEVTVAQTEQDPALPSKTDTGGAGIMFHALSTTDRFLAFIIETDGHWTLWHYQNTSTHTDESWNMLREGYSPAIITGLGARNTILYLQRAEHITVYINNQQVLDDDFPSKYYGDISTAGVAGIISNESALDTTFTHFALYRLPAPPDFWTVVKTG